MPKDRRRPGGPLVRRNFSISQWVHREMQKDPDFNWSELIENFLIVHIHHKNEVKKHENG